MLGIMLLGTMTPILPVAGASLLHAVGLLLIAAGVGTMWRAVRAKR